MLLNYTALCIQLRVLTSLIVIVLAFAIQYRLIRSKLLYPDCLFSTDFILKSVSGHIAPAYAQQGQGIALIL